MTRAQFFVAPFQTGDTVNRFGLKYTVVGVTYYNGMAYYMLVNSRGEVLNDIPCNDLIKVEAA